MTVWVNTVSVLVVLTTLAMLASSRLQACIRLVAFQGILMGLLPVALHQTALGVGLVLTALASVGLKGVVFPILLGRSARQAQVGRELEPLVGYSASILIGVLLLAGTLWLGGRLPTHVAGGSLVAGVALFATLAGLFLIVARRNALTQVLGYLAMENGIYGFGLSFALDQPLVVELGILLDVFMAVFVMGIAIYHINREFDHIDTDRLTELRD